MQFNMGELVLSQFNRLPEPQKIEVLHFIQFLLQKSNGSLSEQSIRSKPFSLTFLDFHFPEKSQNYSRSEIYSDIDGR
jgi:Protein of unknown function (DUF2281)